MQKYINLNQEQIIEYWLSLPEGLALDYIIKANSWAKSICDWDGRTFFRVNIGKLLEDLPALGIKTKWGATKLVNKLLDKWLLNKKLVNKSPYYAPTERTKSYYFTGCIPEEGEGTPLGTESPSLWSDNSNINSNINYITISVAQLKERKGESIKALERLISSLRGETDLKDTSADQVITLWNNYSKEYRLPRIKVGEWTTIEKETKKLWTKFKSEYTKEDFNLGLQNYLTEIKSRKPDWKTNSYYDHRFTLPIFLKQSNWIKKYMLRA